MWPRRGPGRAKSQDKVRRAIPVGPVVRERKLAVAPAMLPDPRRTSAEDFVQILRPPMHQPAARLRWSLPFDFSMHPPDKLRNVLPTPDATHSLGYDAGPY